MSTIKSVKSLSFISVVRIDEYGCPEPQYCNNTHERCFKILPVYQEDRFGNTCEILRYEYVPYIKGYYTSIGDIKYYNINVPF